MNFSGWQARFRRLQDEHATWKLLRADNAPIILAFIADLFAEENEVPFARARIALDAELERGRELGYWQSESGAGIYLNQWIRAGWLREMDDMLSKTDASETALRFCRALDEPTAGTSASHLRIVQEAVRDFAVAINPDLDERVAQLEQHQQEIQRSIDDLRAGVNMELKARRRDTHNLLVIEKTTPSGRGQSSTALPVERLIWYSMECCPHNIPNRRKPNEPIQEAITYDLALSVPHGLGAKVPFSGTARPCCDRSRALY